MNGKADRMSMSTTVINPDLVQATSLFALIHLDINYISDTATSDPGLSESLTDCLSQSIRSHLSQWQKKQQVSVAIVQQLKQESTSVPRPPISQPPYWFT